MKSACRYFVCLSFANAILIAGQMLRVKHPVFDYLAAWALLGIYLTLALLFIAFALAAAAWLLRKIKIAPAAVMIDAGVFAVVVASWMNLARMLFLSQGIHPLWLPTRILLPAAFVLGMVLFPWVKKTGAEQFPVVARNMGMVAGAALAFWLLSLAAFTLRAVPPSIAREPVSLPKNGATPNVIYLVLDAMSSHDMSVYGYALQTTPHLDELARHWTVYENAHSAGTGTVANMPAVLTGRYPVLKPWSLYGDLAGRVKGWLSLADILRARGYRTIFLNGGGLPPNVFHFQNGFDAVITAGAGWYLTHDPLTWSARLPPALWERFVGKHIPLDGILPYPYALGKTDLVEPLYGYIEKVLRRRSAADRRRPFFLYMHMLRPHAPYLANEFAGSFLPLADGFPTFASQLRFLNFPQVYGPGEQPLVNRLRLRYDENIRKADDEVGRFIATLKAENLYDGALIIIAADHGTSFSNGYVGYYSPRLSASEHAIPLLVKFPHQTTGRRVRGLVSTVDILPTVLELLNISYTPEDVDGQPLQAAGENKERVIYVCNATDPARSFAALYKNWELVQRQTERALFDLKSDPDEQTNLLKHSPAPVLENALAGFSRKIAALKKTLS